MSAQILIDQVGLPAGTAGKARTDGLDTGAKVTVTNASGQPCRVELLWFPPDDGAGAATLAQDSPTEWSFTPTASRYGTWTIRLIEDEGLPTETEDIRIFGIRLSGSQLLIPGLNERGDFTIKQTSSASEKAVAALISYNNETQSEGYDWFAWWQSQRELYEFLESLAGGGTYLGLTDTPATNVGQAGFLPTVNAGETAHVYEVWNRIDQGVVWDPDLPADDPATSSYKTWAGAFAAAMAHEGVQTIYLMADSNGSVTYTVTGLNDAENRLRLVHPRHQNDSAELVFGSEAEIQNLLEFRSYGDNSRITILTLGDSTNDAIFFFDSRDDPTFLIGGARFDQNGFTDRRLVKFTDGGRLVVEHNTSFGVDPNVVESNEALEVRFFGQEHVVPAEAFVDTGGHGGALTLTFVDASNIARVPGDFTTSWTGTVSYEFPHYAHHSGYTPTTPGDWSPVPDNVGDALDQIAGGGLSGYPAVPAIPYALLNTDASGNPDWTIEPIVQNEFTLLGRNAADSANIPMLGIGADDVPWFGNVNAALRFEVAHTEVLKDLRPETGGVFAIESSDGGKPYFKADDTGSLVALGDSTTLTLVNGEVTATGLRSRYTVDKGAGDGRLFLFSGATPGQIVMLVGATADVRLDESEPGGNVVTGRGIVYLDTVRPTPMFWDGVQLTLMMNANGHQVYGEVHLDGPTSRVDSITVIDQWSGIAPNTNRYEAGLLKGFTVNTTTGELTYGADQPSGVFKVQLQGTFDKEGASTEWIELAIDLNGALDGTTTNPEYSCANTITPGADQCFFCERLLFLSPGDVLRATARNSGTTDNLIVHLLQLTAVPAPSL